MSNISMAPGGVPPELVKCVGCGALVPDMGAFYGPEHAYVGASPGRWQLYLQATNREFDGERGGRGGVIRELAPHDYMVHHFGVPSWQSIQSVATHLIALYWALERHYSFDQVMKALLHASLGALTIANVAQAADASQCESVTVAWAQSAWQAWREYHPTVREWAGA